jgi:hypothetical protein
MVLHTEPAPCLAFPLYHNNDLRKKFSLKHTMVIRYEATNKVSMDITQLIKVI